MNDEQKERRRQRDKLRYRKNTDKIRMRSMAYYQNNKEFVKHQSKVSRLKRLDGIKKQRQVYASTPAGRIKILLSNARNRARVKGYEFNINDSDVLPMLLAGYCPYTGVPFDLGPASDGSYKNPWAPSIDQIIPGAGYVRENIEVVSVWWNTAKNDWSKHVNELALKGLARKIQR